MQIHDNISKWVTGGAVGIRTAIYIDDTDSVSIQGNKLNLSFADTAIHIESSGGSIISGNYIENGGSAADAINVINSPFIVINSNIIEDTSRAISISSGSVGCTINGNIIAGDNSTPSVIGVVAVSGADTSITGNVISNYSGTYDAIALLANTCIVMSNRCVDGDISLNGTTGHVGYNETQDVNSVNAYVA
jgi:hypothetical protein